jgi:hypothetical protein
MEQLATSTGRKAYVNTNDLNGALRRAINDGANYYTLEKSGVPAHMEIDLPNEDVYLVTGVYDWGTGKTGTLEIPLNPAAVEASAATAETGLQPSLGASLATH